MAQPFLGEIRLCGFDFAPRGWALCNGQLLAISTNQALFSLLGTMYGGNGVSTFALPNFQSRRPIGTVPGGSTYVQGQQSGTESHTLLSTEMPQHNHSVRVSSLVGDSASPQEMYLAASAVDQPYASAQAGTNVEAVLSAGGSQPHENRPPFLVVNFVIALQGIFPSRN